MGVDLHKRTRSQENVKRIVFDPGRQSGLSGLPGQLEHGPLERKPFVFTFSSAFFVVRTKANVLIQRRYSRPLDKSTGERSDQTVILTWFKSASAYPDTLRRVSYFDKETQKRLKFLTNNFVLPALTIAQFTSAAGKADLRIDGTTAV